MRHSRPRSTSTSREGDRVRLAREEKRRAAEDGVDLMRCPPPLFIRPYQTTQLHTPLDLFHPSPSSSLSSPSSSSMPSASRAAAHALLGRARTRRLRCTFHEDERHRPVHCLVSAAGAFPLAGSQSSQTAPACQSPRGGRFLPAGPRSLGPIHPSSTSVLRFLRSRSFLLRLRQPWANARPPIALSLIRNLFVTIVRTRDVRLRCPSHAYVNVIPQTIMITQTVRILSRSRARARAICPSQGQAAGAPAR